MVASLDSSVGEGSYLSRREQEALPSSLRGSMTKQSYLPMLSYPPRLIVLLDIEFTLYHGDTKKLAAKVIYGMTLSL